MTVCKKCHGTGVIETGSNDLPCGCPAGEKALFCRTGVIGLVTGAEIRRHFLNDSPEPINTGKKPILASDLPGRQAKRGIVLDELQQEIEKLLALLKDRQPGYATWHESMRERLTNLRILTSQARGE